MFLLLNQNWLSVISASGNSAPFGWATSVSPFRVLERKSSPLRPSASDRPSILSLPFPKSGRGGAAAKVVGAINVFWVGQSHLQKEQKCIRWDTKKRDKYGKRCIKHSKWVRNTAESSVMDGPPTVHSASQYFELFYWFNYCLFSCYILRFRVFLGLLNHLLSFLGSRSSV